MGQIRTFLTLIALSLGIALQVGLPGGSLEAFIDEEMSTSGVPGLAYAVVENGEIATFGARGVLEVGGDAKVTADTPFLAGSISKSFTALAVMQLVEAGKVTLDSGVSQYLTEFSGHPAGAITIRQLLSHTSGFSTFQGNSSHTDLTGGHDELAHRVNALAEVDPAYQPDERWEYSNTNYEILGRVIEVVSGQDYQSYVTDKILEPVGMVHSFVADGEVHPTMATGHRPWFGTSRPLPEKATDRGTAPQGGIVASARDLALYMQMMMNGQDDVLSAAGKAEMVRPASEASPFYGFGWFLDSSNGSVSHSGLSPGFETLATMVPAENKATVVLVNANGGIGFGETLELRNGITAASLGFEYDGEGSRWVQKATFISLVVLPLIYLVAIVWAWRHRDEIRAKTGIAGLFSLWFPLFTTVVAAGAILWLVPKLLGASLGTINLFQPDLGLTLVAGAVLGVLWAIFRLAIAHTGESDLTESAHT